MIGRSVVLATLLSSLWISAATAATVTRDDTDEGTAFFVDGEIEIGDETKFVDQIVGVPSAVIILSSPGGRIYPAIQIGQAIRLKGFSTYVPDGLLCASACALIWLAGQPRFMGPNAKIGFHAAFDEEGKEEGAANAMVGAYLSGLGLSQPAIFYVTDAPPDGMQWLSIDDAHRLGIDVQSTSPETEKPSNVVEALRTLEEQAEELCRNSPLNFRNVVVVESSKGYRDYVERMGGPFRPDEKLLVYVEPLCLSDEAATMGFKADLVIEDAAGNILVEGKDVFNVTTPSTKGGFSATLSFDVPYIRPGDYIAEFRVRDGNSTKEGTFEVSFTVAIPDSGGTSPKGAFS